MLVCMLFDVFFNVHKYIYKCLILLHINYQNMYNNDHTSIVLHMMLPYLLSISCHRCKYMHPIHTTTLRTYSPYVVVTW